MVAVPGSLCRVRGRTATTADGLWVKTAGVSNTGWARAVTGASAAGSIGVSAGTQSASLSAVTFSNSNNVSFGLNGGVVTASATVLGNTGAVSAGTQSQTLGTITLSNSNGVSFGMNAGVVTASYTQSVGLQALQANATQFARSGTLLLQNSNGISFGISNSTRLTASYTVPSTAGLISNINVSAGTTSNNLTALTLSNSNNVSFGLNGSTITASASYSQSTAAAAIAAGTQTATSGTIVFSNANGVTFGMSGSSRITASVGTSASSGTLSQVKTASLGYSLSYTNGNYTISQATTTNAGGGYGYDSITASDTSIASSYTGLKLIGLGLGASISVGPYWLGILHTQSQAGSTNGFSMSLVGMPFQLTNLAPMGSISSQFTNGTKLPLDIGGNFHLAQGLANGTTQVSLPSTIGISNVTRSGSLVPFLRLHSRV